MDRPAQVCLAGMFVVSQVLLPGLTAGDQPSPRARARAETRVPADRPDLQVVGALRANPLTAPYAIRSSWRDGAVVLSGRVGTKQVHDMAVRTAIAVGYPVKDDLVIDTGEAHRVAMAQASANPWLSGSLGFRGRLGPLLRLSSSALRPPGRPVLRVRASPGQLPPLVAARELRGPGGRRAGGAQGMPSAPYLPGTRRTADLRRATRSARTRADQGEAPAHRRHVGPGPPGRGRRQRAGPQDHRGGGQEYPRREPGDQRASRRVAPIRDAPPPPQPVLPNEPVVRPAKPAPAPASRIPPRRSDLRRAQQAPRPRRADLAMARDPQPLTRRIADALSRRSTLKDLPIAVQTRDGVATLSGKVPSAYEAMMAYRTVEQTPGVRDVVDQLEFQVPDENHPNPLKQKGRPEDIEAYLSAQIRRHLGDLAHVERVRVRGDIVEIRGSLAQPSIAIASWRSSDRSPCSATSASSPCSTSIDQGQADEINSAGLPTGQDSPPLPVPRANCRVKRTATVGEPQPRRFQIRCNLLELLL